jgi:hypothetical protein
MRSFGLVTSAKYQTCRPVHGIIVLRLMYKEFQNDRLLHRKWTQDDEWDNGIYIHLFANTGIMHAFRTEHLWSRTVQSPLDAIYHPFVDQSLFSFCSWFLLIWRFSWKSESVGMEESLC